VLVAGAVTLVAACGGSGDSPRLSAAEFSAKADAICKKYNRDSRAIANPTSLAELSKAIDKLVPILDRSVKNLRKLRPPENEQATVDQWLTQVEAIESDLSEVGAKAAKGDGQAVQAALRKGDSDNKRGNELASKLGLHTCSE
jgi:hypothetical protein